MFPEMRPHEKQCFVKFSSVGIQMKNADKFKRPQPKKKQAFFNSPTDTSPSFGSSQAKITQTAFFGNSPGNGGSLFNQTSPMFSSKTSCLKKGQLQNAQQMSANRPFGIQACNPLTMNPVPGPLQRKIAQQEPKKPEEEVILNPSCYIPGKNKVVYQNQIESASQSIQEMGVSLQNFFSSNFNSSIGQTNNTNTSANTRSNMFSHPEPKNLFTGNTLQPSLTHALGVNNGEISQGKVNPFISYKTKNNIIDNANQRNLLNQPNQTSLSSNSQSADNKNLSLGNNNRQAGFSADTRERPKSPNPFSNNSQPTGLSMFSFGQNQKQNMPQQSQINQPHQISQSSLSQTQQTQNQKNNSQPFVNSFGQQFLQERSKQSQQQPQQQIQQQPQQQPQIPRNVAQKLSKNPAKRPLSSFLQNQTTTQSNYIQNVNQPTPNQLLQPVYINSVSTVQQQPGNYSINAVDAMSPEMKRLLSQDYSSYLFKPVEEDKLQILHCLITAMKLTEMSKTSTAESPELQFQEQIMQEQTVQQFFQKMRKSFHQSFEQLNKLCDYNETTKKEMEGVRRIEENFRKIEEKIVEKESPLVRLSELERKQEEIQSIFDTLEKKFCSSEPAQSETSSLIRMHEECEEMAKEVAFDQNSSIPDKRLDSIIDMYQRLNSVEYFILDLNMQLDRLQFECDLEIQKIKRAEPDCDNLSSLAPSTRRSLYQQQQ